MQQDTQQSIENRLIELLRVSRQISQVDLAIEAGICMHTLNMKLRRLERNGRIIRQRIPGQPTHYTVVDQVISCDPSQS